jgi:hypothetical protein
MDDVTQILNAIDGGDAHAAGQLLPLVYDFSKETGGRIPIGYEVDVNRVLVQQARTGTLWRSGEPVQLVTDSPVLPDIWFTPEVVAQGNRVQIKVNGKEVVDYLDQRKSPLRKGHLALQVAWPEMSKVHFRRIEIKELPPSPLPDDQAR